MHILSQEIENEIIRAVEKYGPFASMTEGTRVLVQEIAELMQAIENNDPKNIREEAIQVTAMGLRFLRQFTKPLNEPYSSVEQGVPPRTERSGV